MAGNNVSVTLGLKDQLTSPLKGVLSGVRSNMSGVGDITSGITSSISGMAAGFVALTATIVTAGLAMSGLGKGVMSAASIQTSMIVSAGDVSNLVGTTYSAALVSVKDIQKEITKMAAALPGETAGYASIANAVTASIALGSKGSLKQMKEDVVDVTRTLGLLAATKGVDMNMAASASNKFMSGSTSISEMFSTNDVFQKNPLFKVYLQSELKAIGKSTEQWQTLDQAVRNKVVVLAGKRAFTKDALTNLEGTADSLIQGIKTSLFDQQTGVFGFLREIPKLGGETALASVQNFLGAIIEVSDSLNKAGFNFDPMYEIAKTLNFLTDTLFSVNLAISKGDWRSLKTIFKSLWAGVLSIPNAIADGFNFVIDLISKIDWNEVVKYLTEGITAIGNAVAKVDWGKLGTSLGDGIRKILTDEKLGIALEKTITLAIEGLGKMISGAIKAAGSKAFESLFTTGGDVIAADGKVSTAKDAKAKYDAFQNSDASWWDKFTNNQPTNIDAKPINQPQSFNGSSNKLQPVAFNPTMNFTGSAVDYDVALGKFKDYVEASYNSFKESTLTTA